MSLNIRPILSSLLRNRTGAVLVALQIALALAILVDATPPARRHHQSSHRHRRSQSVFQYRICSQVMCRYDPDPAVRADLAWLRAFGRRGGGHCGERGAFYPQRLLFSIASGHA